LSKDLAAVDTSHGNEEGIINFLYPLLPKVYVSAADKRANPKVSFCQNTVQKGLYTAYDKHYLVNINIKTLYF
jgi:hypothetical protein